METIIKNTIQELFDKMEAKFEKLDIEKMENGRFKVNLASKESSLLIGYNGTTMSAIEHLINLLLKKRSETEEGIRILLDIDSYRKRQEEMLLSTIDRKAMQVRTTTRPVILSPMSAYLRRVIHLYIAEKFKDLATESIGEGDRRQVVLKMKDEE